MKRAAIVLAFLQAGLVLAEQGTGGGTPPQGMYVAPGMGVYLPPNRGVQVFDDRVFDLTPKEPPPETSKSGRTYAAEPDYNTEGRQRALDACEAIRDKDAQAYRDCFNGNMKKQADERRESAQEVERRQSQPGTGVRLYDDTRRSGSADD